MTDNVLPMLHALARRKANGTDIVRLSVELLRTERERDRLAVLTVAEDPSRSYFAAMEQAAQLRGEWEAAVGTYL